MNEHGEYTRPPLNDKAYALKKQIVKSFPLSVSLILSSNVAVSPC